VSDPLYVQPDGVRSYSQIHDEVVAGLSQLMGAAAPEATGVQASHGAIASAVSTALSSVLGSRQGTMQSTSTSAARSRSYCRRPPRCTSRAIRRARPRCVPRPRRYRALTLLAAPVRRARQAVRVAGAVPVQVAQT
jgi:hypothetical protein